MGLEIKNAFRSDDVSNIVCIVDVYNGIVTITIKCMFINALFVLAQNGRSPLMSVIKRDMPKQDKADMVRLLLKYKADMFAEDNVSAAGMCMCAFKFEGVGIECTIEI